MFGIVGTVFAEGLRNEEGVWVVGSAAGSRQEDDVDEFVGCWRKKVEKKEKMNNCYLKSGRNQMQMVNCDWILD